MATVTAPTAVTIQQFTSPSGAQPNLQALDAVNGNKAAVIDKDRQQYLFQNVNAASRTVQFYCDVNLQEVVCDVIALPGSGTNSGLQLVGPYKDPNFLLHATSIVALQNVPTHVFKQTTGAGGDVKVAPFVPN